jgi:hypothetical protein
MRSSPTSISPRRSPPAWSTTSRNPARRPSGKVGYTLNFYILKPVNLANVSPTLVGRGKVMYEPPNRGGKTWTALDA